MRWQRNEYSYPSVLICSASLQYLYYNNLISINKKLEYVYIENIGVDNSGKNATSCLLLKALNHFKRKECDILNQRHCTETMIKAKLHVDWLGRRIM